MMKSLMTAAALVVAMSLEAGAQSSYKVGHIEVSSVWARASAGRAGAGAAYFEVRNHGAEADPARRHAAAAGQTETPASCKPRSR